MTAAPRLLRVLDFGARLVPFTQALKLQELLHSARHAGGREDTLVLLQHQPVFTIGKRGKDEDFKVPLQDIAARGAEVCRVPRGGEVTFHGPGQLVAYPIVDVRAAGLGARAFVEALEDSIITAIGSFGIRGEGRVKGATGVWVQDRKIAAIGVKISYGISSHGLALNVTTDLSMFDLIVPCGIPDKAVTSIGRELRNRADPSGPFEGDEGKGPSSVGDGVGSGRHGRQPLAHAGVPEEELPRPAGAVAAEEVEPGNAQLYDAAKSRFLSAFRNQFKYEQVQVQRGVEIEAVLAAGAAMQSCS